MTYYATIIAKVHSFLLLLSGQVSTPPLTCPMTGAIIMDVDLSVAVVLVGMVVSALAERLPGLARYWHPLTPKQKRAFVALAAVIVGVVVTVFQGGELNVNQVISDITRYTLLAGGGLVGFHSLGLLKVDGAR